MSIFGTIKRAITKTVQKALSGVNDNRPKTPKALAQMGPAGDTGSRATGADAMRRRSRRSRGRDSTIITSRSEIGSRTLLG